MLLYYLCTCLASRTNLKTTLERPCLGLLRFFVVIIESEVLPRIQIANSFFPVLSFQIVNKFEVLLVQIENAVKVLQDPCLTVALRYDGNTAAQKVAENDLGGRPRVLTRHGGNLWPASVTNCVLLIQN